MADNAAKAMADAIVDTWTSGNSHIANLLTDVSAACSGKDSIGFSTDGAITVASSESSAVQTVSTSESLLTKDQIFFLNRGLTLRDSAQLLNGNYAAQVARNHNGALMNQIDRNLIEYLINNAAQTDYFNASVTGAVPALTDDVIASAESGMLSQPGADPSSLFWLGAPVAVADAKLLAAWSPGAPFSKGEIGYGQVDFLNGYQLIRHAQVPGQLASLRKTVVSTAWAIVSNVLTITVASGHGVKAGDAITFDTVTAGGDLAAAATVTSVTSTTIVVPLTASNANATEAGLVTLQQGYLMLIDSSRAYVAFESAFPRSEMVKREANAGFTHQLSMIGGRLLLSGAIKIVRTRPSVA